MNPNFHSLVVRQSFGGSLLFRWLANAVGLLMLFAAAEKAQASELEQRHVSELISDYAKDFEINVSPTLFPAGVTNDTISLLGRLQRGGFFLRTTNTTQKLTRLLGESSSEYWSYSPDAGLFIARKADSTNADNFLYINWARKIDRIREFLDFGMIYVNARTLVWTSANAFTAKDWKGNPVSGEVLGRDAAGRPLVLQYRIESAAMEQFSLAIKYELPELIVPFSSAVEIRGNGKTNSGVVNVRSLTEVRLETAARLEGYHPGDLILSDTKIEKITIYSNGVRHAIAPDGGLIPYSTDVTRQPTHGSGLLLYAMLLGLFSVIALGLLIKRQKGKSHDKIIRA